MAQTLRSGEGFARGDAWVAGPLFAWRHEMDLCIPADEPAWMRATMGTVAGTMRITSWAYSQERNRISDRSVAGGRRYEVAESNQGWESTTGAFGAGNEKTVRESLLRQLAFLQAGRTNAARQSRR